jgi:hypothetical protein
MTDCLLCRRGCAPSSPLCRYHLQAKTNLESGYKQWSDAYGGITWEEYLQKVGRNAETGQWAKEVARFLSKGEPVRPAHSQP